MKADPIHRARHNAQGGGRPEINWGIHPFEKLCHSCILDDCSPSNKACLQHIAAGHEVKNTKMSWLVMSQHMVRCGLAHLLGRRLIEGYELKDMVKRYQQHTLEEFCNEARKQAKMRRS